MGEAPVSRVSRGTGPHVWRETASNHLADCATSLRTFARGCVRWASVGFLAFTSAAYA
jgi:hypothetical protein